MIEEQKTERVTTDELLSRCVRLRGEDWRLVQIGCTGLPDGSEINYTFDKDYAFLNLRLHLRAEDAVPSIQEVYSCAFLYENEMAELFGVKVSEMPVDFHGRLYTIAEPTPFSEVVPSAKDTPPAPEPPAAKETASPAPAASEPPVPTAGREAE